MSSSTPPDTTAPLPDGVDGATRARDRLRLSGWTALVGFVVTIGVLWGGLRVLASDTGVRDLVAGGYRLFGADAAADAITQYGLTPVTDKVILAVIAITIGVGGAWVLFLTVNRLVDQLGPRFERVVRPWVFVLPATLLLLTYLVYPTVRTVWISFTATGDGGALANYQQVFTDPDLLVALRNNVIWLVVGTTGAVLIGLAFAAMVDRVKREALAKTFIFLPLAISMVGAAVIWRFVYEWRPAGQPQIGIVNAVLDRFGIEPVAFFQSAPLNTFVLVAIMVWIQTGFAMVILSAAIKGVPGELLEAARLDGASEWQIFTKVVVPSIKGSVITVATTIFIAILKVFDIVFVTTGGRFDTDVVANRMFLELVRFRNPGLAAALAVVLLAVVVPIMVLNVRNLRQQGVNA